MKRLNLTNVKKLLKSCLILFMTLLLQTGVISFNANEINAADRAYNVEIVYSYNGSAGTKLAPDVIVNNTEATLYSYKGQTAVGGFKNGTDSGNNQFSQSALKDNVTDFEIHYGEASYLYTHTAGAATGDVFIYFKDGALSTTSSTGATKILKLVKNNSGIFYRFYNVLDDLTIIEHIDTEKNIVINNVSNAQPTSQPNYGTTVKDNVANIAICNIGGIKTAEKGFQFTVEPLEHEIESIDYKYADKYNYRIAASDLNKSFYITKNTTSPFTGSQSTSFVSSSGTPFRYLGSNKFEIYEFASTTKQLSLTYNYKYSVKFDANGGTVEDAETKTLKTTNNKLSSLPQDPVRVGEDGKVYKFDGWYIGDTKIDSSYVYSDDVTVKAKWLENYKVTFDAQGGTFNPTISSNVFYTDSKTFTGKLDSIPTLNESKLDGGKTYYFTGWYDGVDPATANEVNADTVYTKDTNVYACWDDTVYTVTFDCNKSFTGLDSFDVLIGKNRAVSTQIAPTKAGYSFMGWYSDDKYTTPYDFNTLINADKTVYGKYVESVNINVSNSISSVSTDSESDFIAFDEIGKTATIEKNAKKDISFKVGIEHGHADEVQLTYNSKTFTLDSLFVDKDSATYYVDSSDVLQTGEPDGNYQLALTYTAGNDYFTVTTNDLSSDLGITVSFGKLTVKFVDGTTTLNTVQIDHGSKVTKPQDPTKELAEFEAWYEDDKFTTLFDFNSKVLYDDATIYAHFNKIHELKFYVGYGKHPDEGKALYGVGKYQVINDYYYFTTKDYLDGPSSGESNRWDMPRQTSIDYIDLYVGDSKTPLKVDHSISAKGNSVIKGTVYYKDGSISLSSSTGAIKLVTFAATADSETASMASRWFNFVDDVRVVFHYYDEKAITLKNIKSFDATNVSDVFVDQNSNKVTISEKFSNAKNPISLKVTPKDGLVDSIDLTINGSKLTIENKDINSTLYITDKYALSKTSSSTDIAKYSNNEISFNVIDSDVEISYNYRKKVTFNANGGTFADTSTTKELYTINNLINEMPSDVSLSGKYFVGWYDGVDYLSSNYIPSTYVYKYDSNTVYAGWSDTPVYTVSVDGALRDSGKIIETSDSSKYRVFDDIKSFGMLDEGDCEADLKVYASYGKISSVKALIGNQTVDLSEVLSTTSEIEKTSGDSKLKAFYDATQRVFTLKFVKVYANIEFVIEYEDVEIRFLYEDDSTVYDSITIPFNTKVERPTDPQKEKYVFDNWYVSKEFVKENLYDFDSNVLDDLDLYANMLNSYEISFYGVGYKAAKKINDNNKWAADTKGTIDLTKCVAYTFGKYESTTGTVINAYTDIASLENVEIIINDKKYTIDAKDIRGTRFIDKDGNLTNSSLADTDPGRTAYVEGDIIKFVCNNETSGAPNNTDFNIRFYTIDSDIRFNFNSKLVKGSFVDEVGASKAFDFDAKTIRTEIDAANKSFTVPQNDLLDNDENSIRMAITPNDSVMTGLEVYAVKDGKEELVKTYKFNDTQTVDIDGVGKFKTAYSSSDGKFYVRFYTLYTDVVVKPIVSENKDYTVKLVSAANIGVGHEALSSDTAATPLPNKDVKVSEDYRTITVPYNTLTAKDTGYSFRWNLGPTASTGYEYYYVDVLNANGDSITKAGVDSKSYKTVNGDQTFTVKTPSIIIVFNKTKYSDAQIRIWGVSEDITLKVYYKHYKDSETDVDDILEPENANFKLNYKVSLGYENGDEEKRQMYFDYITTDSNIVKRSNGEDESVSFTSGSINGMNTTVETITGEEYNIIKSHIIRVRFVEIKNYSIDYIRVSTADGSIYQDYYKYIDEEGNSKTNGSGKTLGLGDISYSESATGVTKYIRINSLFTDQEIRITPHYVEGNDAPYTVMLDADTRVNLSSYTENPETANISEDLSELTVKYDEYLEGVDGKSFRWDLSSTAGMDYEYSKIEVYRYNENSKEYDILETTLGDKYVSYLESDKNQTTSASIKGLKIKYNKSTYCEAQIRVWSIYDNFKIVVYYKNYETGEEYRANDENISLVYDGIVTIDVGGNKLELENFDKNYETRLNAKQIRFDKFTGEDKGLRYILQTSKEGANIDSITVTVDGKEYILGETLEISKTQGKVLPGAKVRYYRNTDGWAIIRVWSISNDVDIKVNTSYGHKNTLLFNVGDHGKYRITDMPASATIREDNVNLITLWRGSTFNSTHGNKSSVRFDVTPEVGWEVDYIEFTTNGKKYSADTKTLKGTETCVTKIAPGCSVKFNLDSNGQAQIRFVHVDRDTSCKVFYRQRTYKVNMNSQKLSLMRAEAYGDSSKYTEFTKNYAVGKLLTGTTVGRQNGIKYWLAPQDGHNITSAVIENKRGDYVICGEGFADAQFEDYKVKGIAVRYYKGYDGKAEIRYWGVMDDITISIFYDGEKPHPHMSLPADFETYDIGEYVEPVDNMKDLEPQEEIIENEEISIIDEYLPYIIVGGSVVVLGAALFFTRKLWTKLFKAK